MTLYKRLFSDKKSEQKAEQTKSRKELEDEALADANKSLLELYHKFQSRFERQRYIALANEENGIFEQDNYAELGLAYYSMLLINMAQKRLSKIRNMRELDEILGELTNTVNFINHAGNRKSTIDTRKLVEEAGKMSKTWGGSSRELLTALLNMSNLKLNSPDDQAENTGIDKQVNMEFFKELIHGGSVAEYIKKGGGIPNGQGKNSDFREMIRETGVEDLTQEDDDVLIDRTLAEMHDLLRKM